MMDMRGFIDSSRLSFSHYGKFYPLVVKPKSVKTIARNSIIFSRYRSSSYYRAIGSHYSKKDYYSEISNLFITEEALKLSPLPHIVPMDL